MTTKSYIYGIWDKKAEILDHIRPVSHPSKIMRECQDSVNDPRSTFFNHFKDFELFLLCTVDMGTGEISHGDQDPIPLHAFKKPEPE